MGGAESGALGRSGPRSRGGVRTTPQLLARGATGLQQPGLDTVHKPLAAAATAQARARADAAITLRGSPPTSADAAVGRATRRRGPARLKERCSAGPRIWLHCVEAEGEGEGRQGRLQERKPSRDYRMSESSPGPAQLRDLKRALRAGRSNGRGRGLRRNRGSGSVSRVGRVASRSF